MEEWMSNLLTGGGNSHSSTIQLIRHEDPESIEKAIESGNETELKDICENLHPADAAAAFTALDEDSTGALCEVFR